QLLDGGAAEAQPIDAAPRAALATGLAMLDDDVGRVTHRDAGDEVAIDLARPRPGGGHGRAAAALVLDEIAADPWARRAGFADEGLPMRAEGWVVVRGGLAGRVEKPRSRCRPARGEALGLEAGAWPELGDRGVPRAHDGQSGVPGAGFEPRRAVAGER